MKELKKFAPFVALAMAVVVFIMAFLPGVTATILGQTSTITGLKLAFGGFGGNLGDSGFVFVNFLAYFGPLLAAIAIAVLIGLKKNKGLVKLVLGVVLALLFLLSIIFLAMVAKNAWIGAAGATLAKAGYKLAAGSIIGIVASVIGLLASGFDVVMQVLKK